MLEIFYKMQPLDYVYLLVGIILFIFAIQSFLDKEHKYRIGTGLFWLLYSGIKGRSHYFRAAFRLILKQSMNCLV